MIKSQWKKILAVVACMCMVLTIIVLPSSVNAAQEEKGSIEVVAKPHYAGLPLYLVAIGDYKNGEIALYDEFKQFDIQSSDFSNNSELSKKLFDIRKYVRENDVEGIIRFIGADGNATFRDLDTEKLYVITQPVVTRVVDIAPALAFIPAWDESGAWNYHLRIEVKPSEPTEHENLGGMVLHKKDDKNRPLKDAEFSIWRKNAYSDGDNLPERAEDYELGEDEHGKYYWYRLPGYTLVTNDKGEAFADELYVDYQYRLIEEKAPEGYKLDKTPHEFYVEDHCQIEMENDVAVVSNGTAPIIEVINMPTTEQSGDSSEVIDDSMLEEQSQSSKSSSSQTPSYPTPSRSTTVTTVPTTPDIGKVIVEITGDDMVKYIVIPVVVGVSLLLVILLFVLGGRKKDKK